MFILLPLPEEQGLVSSASECCARECLWTGAAGLWPVSLGLRCNGELATSRCQTVSKWTKKAQCRPVPEPPRAESISLQALHRADSISLGSEGDPTPGGNFPCSSRAAWARRCTQHCALLAPFHFPVGNSTKGPPPASGGSGELTISLCSWQHLGAACHPKPLGYPGDVQPWGEASAGVSVPTRSVPPLPRLPSTSAVRGARGRAARDQQQPRARPAAPQVTAPGVPLLAGHGLPRCFVVLASRLQSRGEPRPLSRCNLKSRAHAVAVHQKVF